MLSSFWVDLMLTLVAEEAPVAPPAPAQQAQGSPWDLFKGLLVPMGAVFVIFWLLVFRPESRKRREREQMISAVKKGDTVVTQGGIIGKVWRVDGGEVVVQIDRDKDVKVRFTKAAIIDVVRQEDDVKVRSTKPGSFDAARQEYGEESESSR